jgi:translocator assembly and maintenance protein 41
MLSSARTPIRRSAANNLISVSRAPDSDAHSTSTNSPTPPTHAPQPKANPPGVARSRTLFNPTPRTQSAQPRAPPLLPYLAPNFGKNQQVAVPDETRALLERVVGEFAAPIRYAFGYGSGIFAQAGYDNTGKRPMLDFIFAVSHPGHWHSINMQQHPHHYPYYARTLGSDFVAQVQDVRPGLWFNALVPMQSGDVVRIPLFN